VGYPSMGIKVQYNRDANFGEDFGKVDCVCEVVTVSVYIKM
jgi:hypothetical protein